MKWKKNYRLSMHLTVIILGDTRIQHVEAAKI